MKDKRWIWKGLAFGLFLWVFMYVGLPYFDEKIPLEPEKNLLHLLFALPAGIAWGYFRFVVIPKKAGRYKETEDRSRKTEDG